MKDVLQAEKVAKKTGYTSEANVSVASLRNAWAVIVQQNLITFIFP